MIEPEIFDCATEFRLAIERTDRARLPIGLTEFPAGSCSDASILLGVYLSEKGHGEFELIRGHRGRMDDDTYGTHAWLFQNDLVVDITADQFDEIEQSVLVKRDSDWHEQFEIDGRNLAHFKIYDSNTCSTLRNAYRVVMKTMGAT